MGRAGGAPGEGSEAAGSGPSLSGAVLEEEPVRAEGAAERRGAGPRGRSPGGCWGKPRGAAGPAAEAAPGRGRAAALPGAARGRASGYVGDGRAL